MEIIKAMLADGWQQVSCMVSDVTKEPRCENHVDLVHSIYEDAMLPYKCLRQDWHYATPFDLKTGRVIVDYVDGQVVLL